MGRDMRKPAFWVAVQVRLIPICSATETSKKVKFFFIKHVLMVHLAVSQKLRN